MSRGIPYTLIELGAPAAIANLSPIADKSAMDISLDFYRNTEISNIGEALRKTRENMTRRGMLSVYWGTTILIGDPYYIFLEQILQKLDKRKILFKNFLMLI